MTQQTIYFDQQGKRWQVLGRMPICELIVGCRFLFTDGDPQIYRLAAIAPDAADKMTIVIALEPLGDVQ